MSGQCDLKWCDDPHHEYLAGPATSRDPSQSNSRSLPPHPRREERTGKTYFGSRGNTPVNSASSSSASSSKFRSSSSSSFVIFVCHFAYFCVLRHVCVRGLLASLVIFVYVILRNPALFVMFASGVSLRSSSFLSSPFCVLLRSSSCLRPGSPCVLRHFCLRHF